MNDVASTLEVLGYLEVRLTGGTWVPTDELTGELGTTDETRIHTPPTGSHHARLLDADTEDVIGYARKACPLPSREG